MKKSVYSLVLMDDVIKAVDEQAYHVGTSRSNLINRILAEHFSCVTPESRMNVIFDSVADLFRDNLMMRFQRSAELITLKTALDYKYRPTISYKVELERLPGNSLGTLKVQLRTQSVQLIELFGNFFSYLMKIEAAGLATLGIASYNASLSTAAFSRGLMNSGLDEEAAGRAIADYINFLNKYVQLYFSSPQSFLKMIPELEADYRKLLEHYVI